MPAQVTLGSARYGPVSSENDRDRSAGRGPLELSTKDPQADHTLEVGQGAVPDKSKRRVQLIEVDRVIAAHVERKDEAGEPRKPADEVFDRVAP